MQRPREDVDSLAEARAVAGPSKRKREKILRERKRQRWSHLPEERGDGQPVGSKPPELL